MITLLIYKAYGTTSNWVYYGVCQRIDSNNDAVAVCEHSFMNEARRRDMRQGTEQEFMAHNPNPKFLVVGFSDDPVAAVKLRNKYRENDIWSISAPTTWPLDESHGKIKAPTVAVWHSHKKVHENKARYAYQQGIIKHQKVMELVAKCGREQIAHDLDKLMFGEWYDKYK